MFSIFPSFFSLSFIPFHFSLCTGSVRKAHGGLLFFSLHSFLVVLSAIAVYRRLSKVTVGSSVRRRGDRVIVQLSAYAFVCISKRLNSFHDLSSQSEACLLGISIWCSLCRYGFHYLSYTFCFFLLFNFSFVYIAYCLKVNFSVCFVGLQRCQSTAALVAVSFVEVPLYRLHFVLQTCEYSASPRILVFHSLTTGTDCEFKMTCHLNIAAKLVHPPLNAAPLRIITPLITDLSTPSWNASCSHCTFHPEEWANSPVN